MNMKVEHVGSLNLYLSTWNTDHLETRIKPTVGDPVVDPNFTEGTTGELVSIYKVSLWISNPGNPAGGTNAEWQSLVGGSQGAALETTYTFTYVTPTLGGDDIDITNAKLPFYYAAKATGDAAAYDHSKEAVTPAEGDEPTVHSFDTPSVKDLYDAGATAEGSAKQVGYLYFRVEGSGVEHNRAKTYKGSIVATAPDLA